MKKLILLATMLIMRVCLVGCSVEEEKVTLNPADLERISQEEYAGMYISMYPTEGYNEDDFSYYRGLDTLILGAVAENIEMISAYMDKAFEAGNSLTNVYLGIDPAKIWNQCKNSEDRWMEKIEESLLSYFAANPQITFEIMLAYPELSYWTGMSEEAQQEVMEVYRSFVGLTDVYSNVITYYLGAEEWLISNPANYLGEGNLNPVISKKLMLYTFCDHDYQIAPGNADYFFNKLTAVLAKENKGPKVYPDLSEWKILFLGDSIIGNYEGSYSVPGVISGLSGAETYNYAIGGTQASDREGYQVSFPDMVAALQTQNLGTTRDNTRVPYEALEAQDANICFAIHYGLNDYFNGIQVENPDNPYDTETFLGALRVGVEELQSLYPDAVILLMTPPYCIGTEAKSPVGGVLLDYVEVVEKVAEEYGVACMNSYEGLGITDENSYIYQDDGVHLNGQGRFILGQYTVERLEQWIKQNNL